MTDIEKQAKKEYRRVVGILKAAGLSENKLKALAPVITNTAWMQVKLESARADIEDMPIVIEYDNGGGQRGIRENPLFKGYESLFRSYMAGMNRILDSLPAEVKAAAVPEEEQPKNVLSLITAKHKREA